MPLRSRSGAVVRRPSGRAARVLTVVAVTAIVLLAFNLRPAAVSVGPVLADLRDGLGMNGVEAGALTALPVLSFAVFGSLAPRAAAVVGVHRLALAALLAVVVGLWARTHVHDVAAFLALSLLALAGMASANVVMPSLVKLHFPDRVGAMTAVYTTALAVGLTAASVLTVPIEQAYGGWRSGLEAWALTAGVAVIPWLGMIRHDSALEPARDAVPMRAVARTRLGRRMALFFGLQALQAYSVFGWFAAVYAAAGFSHRQAGALLGVITGISIPLSMLVPTLAARMSDQRILMYLLMGCYPVGYVGLIVAPSGGAWVWAVLVGIGASTFPLILTLIGLRARTTSGTAALSGFTQGAGYLIAAIGPFGMGLLRDASGGWTLPLLVLLGLTIPQLGVGVLVARPAYVEDELRTNGD